MSGFQNTKCTFLQLYSSWQARLPALLERGLAHLNLAPCGTPGTFLSKSSFKYLCNKQWVGHVLLLFPQLPSAHPGKERLCDIFVSKCSQASEITFSHTLTNMVFFQLRRKLVLLLSAIPNTPLSTILFNDFDILTYWLQWMGNTDLPQTSKC